MFRPGLRKSHSITDSRRCKRIPRERCVQHVDLRRVTERLFAETCVRCNRRAPGTGYHLQCVTSQHFLRRNHIPTHGWKASSLAISNKWHAGCCRVAAVAQTWTND